MASRASCSACFAVLRFPGLGFGHDLFRDVQQVDREAVACRIAAHIEPALELGIVGPVGGGLAFLERSRQGLEEETRELGKAIPQERANKGIAFLDRHALGVGVDERKPPHTVDGDEGIADAVENLVDPVAANAELFLLAR